MSPSIDPRIKTSWDKMEREYPNETTRTNRVMQMGPIMKFLTGNAHGAVTPFGTMHINADTPDMDNTIAHELRHIGQGANKSVLQRSYGQHMNNSALEHDAYEEEYRRGLRKKNFGRDVNLPNEKR